MLVLTPSFGPEITRSWILPFAAPDIQTQETRLARLNGLRGMAWAYSVCHYLWKKPTTISLQYSAPNSSLGRADGPKQSSNVMHRYISGKSAPVRGPRGKLGFDLVGAISAHPKGALAERSLDLRIFKMLHPDISLMELRALLFEIPEMSRLGLFDLDPARKDEHAAWRRHPFDDFVLPPALVEQLSRVYRDQCDPREIEAPLLFGLFETLVGLWAESRLVCDRDRMAKIFSIIKIFRDLVFADETFPYIVEPFLAFLRFDGPDRAPK